MGRNNGNRTQCPKLNIKKLQGNKSKQGTTSEIDGFLQPKFCWETIERLTTAKIERTLARPEYTTLGHWDKTQLTLAEKAQVNKYESVTSFGSEIANLFEDMMNKLGHIPTQKDYIAKGVELTVQWWLQNSKSNIKLQGTPFTPIIQKACEQRLARTWISNIVEIHTKLLIQETLPDYTVFSHDLLDLVAGVDLVLEEKHTGDSDPKRYYIHIFKNTTWGMKSFKQKEKRGGLYKGKKFLKYPRNFDGDVILAYEWNTSTEHVSTKFINGVPLFKQDFIEWKFQAVKKTALGENMGLSAPTQTKLEHLQEWIQTHFDRTVDFRKEVR